MEILARCGKVMPNYTDEMLALRWQTSSSEAEKGEILAELCDRQKVTMQSVASRYQNVALCDFSDRVQIMRLALLKVLPRFDAARGAKLSSLCYFCYVQQMNNEFRRQVAQRRCPVGAEVSLDCITQQETDESVPREGFWLSHSEAGYSEVECRDLIDSLGLTQMEHAVCMALWSGKRRADIARDMGISPTRVGQYVQKLQNKFRASKAAVS